MKFIGLSQEQKQEVIDFNNKHLDFFIEEEAIREAEEAIQNTGWDETVTLELSQFSTKSGNTETLTLGKVNDFYTEHLEIEE